MSHSGRRVRYRLRFGMVTLAAAAAVLAAALPQHASAATAPAATAVTPEPADDSPVGEPTTLSEGWHTPWDIAFLPGGRAALVTERPTGEVYRLDRDGTRTRVGTVPYTDATPTENGQGGLLGVAPSPTWNGTTDQRVYFVHTTKKETRVVRMSYDGRSLGDYTPLVTGIAQHGDHYGGRIAFGPDGYLYVSTGEAYQPQLAQDLKSLNGKILRITTTGAPAPGNPFGDRIYSYGHRNPEGLAWDRYGRLWSVEVGAETWDELNLIKPGANYGWPTCEGACDVRGMTNPKAVFAPEWGVPAQVVVVRNVLYVSTLRGQRLWRAPILGNSESIGDLTAFYAGTYGRLRAMARVPGADELWLGTSDLGPGKDKILRVPLKYPPRPKGRTQR